MTAVRLTDRFHRCALAAGFLAASACVKKLASKSHENGAFRDRGTSTTGAA